MVSDEEDIAVSAFGRFAQLIQDGRFPESADRDDLWRLLIAIAVGKIVDYIREETGQKRGRGGVRGESVFHAKVSGSSRLLGGFDQIEAASLANDDENDGQTSRRSFTATAF